MSSITAGLIYVHTSGDSGLPVWATFLLTLVGCAIAIWILRGLAFLLALPASGGCVGASPRCRPPREMADWAKRLDGYHAQGKRQRINVVSGPKVQYVSMRADRGQVRVRMRAKARRRFEPESGPRKEPLFGWRYRFEEFWTLARRGEDWNPLVDATGVVPQRVHHRADRTPGCGGSRTRTGHSCLTGFRAS